MRYGLLLAACVGLWWLAGDKVRPELVDHLVCDFAATGQHALDVALEELVRARLVVLVERGEEVVGVLLDKLRLVRLRVEAHDHLLHLFLGKLGLLVDVLNFFPRVEFALGVRHGRKAVDASLHCLVGLVLAQNLLHEAELGYLLDGRLTTQSLEKIPLLPERQSHHRRLLPVLDKCLAALEPPNDELTLVLRLEELVYVFNDLRLDIF